MSVHWGDPLGARAMYLGGTAHSRHQRAGDHRPLRFVRLHPYARVNVGTKVIVQPMDRRADNADSQAS